MFKDREHAGILLAQQLTGLSDKSYLLAIPRGGVVVAEQIAQQLNIEMNLLITRKLGHPLNPEVGIGAVMPDGSAIYDQSYLDRWAITKDQLAAMITTQVAEIKRRMKTYTGSDAFPIVQGKDIILTDDGIATGYTILAAIRWLKQQKPLSITIAVPVAPPDVITRLEQEADKVVCLVKPIDFCAVGYYYDYFLPTTDQQVITIMQRLLHKKS